MLWWLSRVFSNARTPAIASAALYLDLPVHKKINMTARQRKFRKLLTSYRFSLVSHLRCPLFSKDAFIGPKLPQSFQSYLFLLLAKHPLPSQPLPRCIAGLDVQVAHLYIQYKQPLVILKGRQSVPV
jgi:hypothetical protein